MISREEKLSIQKQVRLLRLSRSSFYYRPYVLSGADLKLMRQIDELHLEYLHAYESVSAARSGIGSYIDFFNQLHHGQGHWHPCDQDL